MQIWCDTHTQQIIKQQQQINKTADTNAESIVAKHNNKYRQNATPKSATKQIKQIQKHKHTQQRCSTIYSHD